AAAPPDRTVPSTALGSPARTENRWLLPLGKMPPDLSPRPVPTPSPEYRLAAPPPEPDAAKHSRWRRPTPHQPTPGLRFLLPACAIPGPPRWRWRGCTVAARVAARTPLRAVARRPQPRADARSERSSCPASVTGRRCRTLRS